MSVLRSASCLAVAVFLAAAPVTLGVTRAAAEPVQTMHSQPWNLSVSTLANTALHTLPVLPHDPAKADAEATVAQGKEMEEDEDEAQAASIAQQI